MFYERKEIRSLRKKTKPGIYGLHRKLLIRCYCSASADATHLPTNTYMSVGRSMKEKEGRQAYIVIALIWDTRIIRYLDCNVTERQEWWYFPLTDSCQYCLFFGLNPCDYSYNPILSRSTGFPYLLHF